MAIATAPVVGESMTFPFRLDCCPPARIVCLFYCPRVAISLFTAFIFLFGALAPSWHQGTASAAASSELAKLQLLFGDQAEALAASICQHDDDDSSPFPGQDELPFCKKGCPLCLTLAHHLPALALDGPAFPPLVRMATMAFLPARTEPEAGHRDLGQGRPRAISKV
jgi:hypothetical protein